MTELFLDIETLPCNDDRAKKEIADTIKVPGNMSKPETIAKWEAEDKPKLIEEALAKTSLDGTYGRVCCITWAVDDNAVKGYVNRDEEKLLKEFFISIESDLIAATRSPTVTKPIVVGHNVSSFDLRFMWQRAIINGVKPPVWMPWDSKPWGEYVRDTMVMWNSEKEKRISLHKLCLALGVESPKDKNGMTGADVALLWQKREYGKILTYGCDDTDAMRKCYRKMTI